MMEYRFSLGDINQVAEKIAGLLTNAKVVVLNGQMGAGKTTFSSALCHALGTTDAVASPTYSIINQYALPGGKSIYHMDWYRLADEEEAIQAGVEDALYSGQICLVEWPERAAGLLPENYITLNITVEDEQTRTLTVVS